MTCCIRPWEITTAQKVRLFSTAVAKTGSQPCNLGPRSLPFGVGASVPRYLDGQARRNRSHCGADHQNYPPSAVGVGTAESSDFRRFQRIGTEVPTQVGKRRM
jgi:hypothetical protein